MPPVVSYVTLAGTPRLPEREMKAIVVYESVFGNTHAIAEAVAEGLGGVPVVTVREAVERTGDIDLLVVGGPTHAHGLATDRTRHVAVEHAQEGAHVELDAAEEPGLRSWLGDIRSTTDCLAAVFDTRADGPALLTGSAARGIARRLHHHGFHVRATHGFVVTGAEGPAQARRAGAGAGVGREARPLDACCH